MKVCPKKDRTGKQPQKFWNLVAKLGRMKLQVMLWLCACIHKDFCHHGSSSRIRLDLRMCYVVILCCAHLESSKSFYQANNSLVQIKLVSCKCFIVKKIYTCCAPTANREYKWEKKVRVKEQCINPFHPNVSINILHTILCTLPNALTRRIVLTIKSFFGWWSFPLFSWP